MANKFAENVQIEEDKAYQDWLDAHTKNNVVRQSCEPRITGTLPSRRI